MKKILFLFIVTSLSFQCFSQSIDEMRKQIHEEMKNEIFLKEFDSYLTPNSEIRNSLVLSKDKKYKFYTYLNKINEQQITFFDNKDNIVFQSKPDQKGVTSFSFECHKTGVYHLLVKNLTNKELNNLIIFASNGELSEEKSWTIEKEESETLFFVVDNMPKFKGKGIDDFKDYIKNNLIYPQEAIDQKIEGRVFVQFTISETGYVKDAKVVRGVHPALNQEALRIVYSSPKWEPGTQRGQAVNVVVTFPVIFEL